MAGAVYYKRAAAGATIRAADADALRAGLTAAQDELKNYKNDVAIRVLNRWGRVRVNGQAPSVTIRFAQYANDYPIVEEIENIVRTRLGWDVEKNGTNDPVLPQAKQFKVLFESGFFSAFDDIAVAFSEASLLGGGVSVGQVHVDNFEQGKLFILVLPS